MKPHETKNRGWAPQITHFNRVFYETNHPFSGTPIFGNSHKDTFLPLDKVKLQCQSDVERSIVDADRHGAGSGLKLLGRDGTFAAKDGTCVDQVLCMFWFWLEDILMDDLYFVDIVAGKNCAR